MTVERLPINPPSTPKDREVHYDPDGKKWVYFARYSAWFTS
jgi:hypothetical protein